MGLQAVILAGSRSGPNPLLRGTPYQNKALLPVCGKAMVLRVFEAIYPCKHRPEMVISTNDPEVLALDYPMPFTVLPSEFSASESILHSLSRLPDAEQVLFVSADHPLLTPTMVEYFLAQVTSRNLGFAMAVVSKQTVLAKYPNAQRTFFPTKGGAYSGGNLIFIDKTQFKPNPEFLNDIETNRKNLWRTLRWLGLGNVLRYVTGQLDLAGGEPPLSQVMGCPFGFVQIPFAECCMDVDKPSDHGLAERILKQREALEAAARLPIPASDPTQRSAAGVLS